MAAAALEAHLLMESLLKNRTETAAAPAAHLRAANRLKNRAAITDTAADDICIRQRISCRPAT